MVGVLLGVNRRIGVTTDKIEEGNLEVEEECIYGDVEFLGMVLPVLGGCSIVGRSTKEGNLIGTQSSVLN